MGQGLGKNSPVLLTLGKDNYEALIDRHGQWTRWRIASKCSCVKYGSMQPDIHCKICAGRGYTYSYQKNQIVYEIVMMKDSLGILELNSEYELCDFVEVYDVNGKKYPSAEKLGKYVHLNTSELPIKGTYFTVVMVKDNENVLLVAMTEKGNMGYYTVPGLMNGKSNIDGIYYKSPSDIISIEKIVDAAGIEYQPKEFRLNQFRIEPTTQEIEGETVEIPITEPVTVYNVKYIPPFIFVILSQNLSKADAQSIVDVNGDAVVSFPYNCNVANDDILTVLAGSYTNKEVLVRNDYPTDTLGVYFVYNVISCTGIQNGEIVEYKEGIDFILVENNKIKWLDDGNYPDSGDTYSITYNVLPTYKVVKQIPQVRTSENQRFPKKAVIKLFTTYSENLGVNKQVPGRNGVSGSY